MPILQKGKLRLSGDEPGQPPRSPEEGRAPSCVSLSPKPLWNGANESEALGQVESPRVSVYLGNR